MSGLEMPQKREALAVSVSLLTSLSTLVCCALPAMLVALGAGAVMAGVVTAAPQLVWLSRHKGSVFVTAGLMLFVAFWVRRASRDACPADPAAAATCRKLRAFGGVALAVSGAVYIIAVFFAFVAPVVLD